MFGTLRMRAVHFDNTLVTFGVFDNIAKALNWLGLQDFDDSQLCVDTTLQLKDR